MRGSLNVPVLFIERSEIMPKRQLDPKVKDFLRMSPGTKGGYFERRNRLTVRQRTIVVAEIIKKEVRKINKKEPFNKMFGVSVFDVCPTLFSDSDNGRALNYLVKNEGLTLSYSHGSRGTYVGIKF